MPVSYEQAPEPVHEMAREIMRQHHAGPGGLKFMGPDGPEFMRLCILLAFADEEDGAAVKRDGYPVQAIVSAIPLKQRVDKRADAEVVIDRAVWETLNDDRRRALLDHCITHLEIKTDENGCVKTDDIGRPQLRVKLADWNLRGFRSIARRYGNDAPEVVAAQQFAEDFGPDVLEKNRLFA